MRCERLVRYRRELALRYPDYHCRPVAAWGPASAALLIVGPAPGLHGANRSGIPFTGDASGRLLFSVLTEAGFSVPESGGEHATRITNAVKCVPPQNRPVAAEIRACRPYLAAELDSFRGPTILALGLIAHQAVVDTLGLSRKAHPFRHAAEYELPGGQRLLDTYHPSRQNVNTGRLTRDMLLQVVRGVLR